MATTTQPPVKDSSGTKTRAGQASRLETARAAVTEAVADAATTAGSLAADASTRIPADASTTRAAFDDANRRIRASSDDMLRLGTTLSFGVVVGMLVAGANRLLVAAALVPLTMFGLTMLERSSARDTATMQAR
jgi:hypothetical protein